MHRVQTVMGIPVSIDIPAASQEVDFTPAFDRLQSIDLRFSTYKPDSELSHYRDGSLRESQIGKELVDIKKACAKFESVTDGYFSAYYDGTFDPTGYVKGWAIQQTADAISNQGFLTYLINAGGDILAASDGIKHWNIGLQHPLDKQAVFGTVSLTNGAVATSGTYERGNHIINPHTHLPTTELVSATVYGPSIIVSDVFATACQAMGPVKACQFIDAQPGYEGFFVSRNGDIVTSAGFKALT